MLRKSTKQPKKKSEDLSEFDVNAEFIKAEDFSDFDSTLEDGLDPKEEWDEDHALDKALNDSIEDEDLVLGFDPEVLEEEPLEEIQEERINGLADKPESRRVGNPDRWKIIGFGNANAGTTKKVKDEDPEE